MGGWTGNAGAPGPPPGGAAQGPPRLGRTPAKTVAAPTGLHARPPPRRLCLCCGAKKRQRRRWQDQLGLERGGALGDGGVERAAGLGRRALGHPVHPAPGTPLPPEVTPRLPPASPLFSAALCTSSCRPAASCKTREFGGFWASHLRPFFLYLSGQLQGVFQGCGLLCCLLLPPAAAAACCLGFLLRIEVLSHTIRRCVCGF